MAGIGYAGRKPIGKAARRKQEENMRKLLAYLKKKNEHTRVEYDANNW